MDIEKYLQELEEIVNIDSGSKNKQGVESICNIFYERFLSLGLRVKKHYINENAGPCLEIRNKEKDDIDILILGHMDTVFEEGEAKKRPFTIKGNRAYGPGVSDMKASLVLIYHVMKELIKEENLDTSICILFNPDEEISSIYSRELIKELGRKSSYALVLEPARPDGSFVAKRKGVMKYKIEFEGVAAHSGNNHKKGKSAIQELAHWILELHELTDYKKGTTVNVGVVEGGNSANVVCPEAICEVDVRIESKEEAKRIKESIKELEEHVSTEGVEVNVSGGITRPPMPMTKEREELHKIVEEIGDEEHIDVHFKNAGGASDGNLLASEEVPVIDAIGPIGGCVHNENEYLEIDSVEPMLRLIKKLIIELSIEH